MPGVPVADAFPCRDRSHRGDLAAQRHHRAQRGIRERRRGRDAIQRETGPHGIAHVHGLLPVLDGQQRGGVRDVHAVRRDAGGARGLQHLAEARELCLRRRRIGLVGAREMRRDAGEAQPRARGDARQQTGRALGGHAEPAHAGIHLHVDTGADVEGVRSRLEPVGLPVRVHHRLDAQRKRRARLRGVADAGQQQQRGIDPVPPQLGGFGQHRDGEAATALLSQPPDHRDGAVPVGVRFDHRDDVAAAGPRPEADEVARERAEIDRGVAAIGAAPGAARKRVRHRGDRL